MAKLIAAGPFATIGEELTAKELEHLPANWIVVCNKVLPTNDGRSYEIDFIVIGTNWVFVLDEKSWKGKITGDDQFWIRSDGSSERSPLTKADVVAKILAGHIRSRVPTLQHEYQHFVRAGVIFSAQQQLPRITNDPRTKDGIFLLSQVCQRLRQIDVKEGCATVQRERESIRKSLIDLSHRSIVPSEIDMFTIEETNQVRPGVRVLQARFKPSNEPRILMMYDLGRDPYSAEQSRKFYWREFKALNALQATGIVPDVKDPFSWSENFLIVPIVPPLGKSVSAYPLIETQAGFIHELEIAQKAFEGLELLRKNNIVHRSLGPDAIHVHQEGRQTKVIFTNFFAARTEESTIAISLDALTLDDPYMAPELISGYHFAGPQSDTFSLALAFLERWTKTPVTTLRPSVAATVTIPDLQMYWPSVPADVVQELNAMFLATISPRFQTPRPRPQQIAQIMGEIAQRLRDEMDIVEGTLLDDRYKVIRSLGQGAMAHTYLALDLVTDKHLAVKRFFRSTDYKQGIAEFQALCDLDHANLPRIYHVNTPDKEVHVIMEYIPGTLLSNLEQEYPWPIERWWTFALGLLNAVEELEKHNLLHRDIKPANIILHEDDLHPVLIDFGFATPKDMSKTAAGTLLYLPPEASTSPQPPASCDLYATALVLFKVLTNELPFATADDGYTRTVRLPATITDEKIIRIANILLTALSPNPAERPTSTSELRIHLHNTYLALNEPAPPPELHDEINSWVDQLRSLYRNSEVGNANNRGMDSDFVRDTYVETALDKVLLPALFQHHPKVIFLSGNPGDGKTAFLERVQEELRSRGAEQQPGDDSGWEWTYQGHTFRSCYDASEANAGLSADQQLTHKLAGLEGASKPVQALTVLVAINDGRLADYFDHYHEQFPWLARQLRAIKGQTRLEQQDIWLIDLKRRTFVNLPDDMELSIFQDVLERLIDEERWQICHKCAAQHVCPISNNALSMNKARVTERLEYLLLLTHLSQQRHITMRDLRSTLAYLITANKNCSDIHAARHSEDSGASLINLSYWQLTFASRDQEDALLQEFAELDPARFTNPRLDRFLHFHRAPADAELRRQLFVDQQDLDRRRFFEDGPWMAAIKRKLYFGASTLLEKRNENTMQPQIRWQDMLPYQYAGSFIDILRGQADMAQMREKLALGLLRSEGITGKVPPGRFTIKVKESEKQQLVILKQFLLDQFVLQVERPNSTLMIETIPAIIVLQHASGTPRLEITLDLFELLMRMAHGLRPTAPEFDPLCDDLKPFKDALLLQETQDLVLIENQQRVHYITQKDGKIVRTLGIERL